MSDTAQQEFKVPDVPKSQEEKSDGSSLKDARTVEQEQEAKLRSNPKYANLPKPKGPSSFLQKRLQKGKQYFDSGDYNMAKSKVSQLKKPIPAQEKVLIAQESTGDIIPTPQDLQRRSSQHKSNLVEEVS
ncbi:unnamed protein product [Owenia fusiformis]|uniref:Uncharacterized protein n=1 Tax=Owenia fusiformis TaxID=6347 RepID=A0A8J1XVG9_OWEFU|nr:unnamed protein product [Owenia fusiformis]